MPGFVGCLNCPFRDRPERCHALASGHHALCRPEYRELVEARTLGQPTPKPERRARQPLTPEAEKRLRLHARMIGCEHRRPDGKRCVDCRGLCLKDGGEGVVVRKDDCYRCLSG